MQWSVVLLVGGSSNIGISRDVTGLVRHKGGLRGHAEGDADLFNAKAALDRIVIPEDTVDRISKDGFAADPRSLFQMKDQAQKQAEERNL